MYLQQGDVILKKIGTRGLFLKEYDSIPADAVKREGNLLYKGALNSHAIYGGEFEMLEKEGTVFVRVTKDAILDHVKDLQSGAHAEHGAMQVPVGEYFLDIVNEYDHALEESRKIID